MIAQVEDAIGKDDCRLLMKLYDQLAHVTNLVDYAGHPIVDWPLMREMPDARSIFPSLVRGCVTTIRAALQLSDPLYPETLILAAIGPGGRHSRHADNCRQNDRGDWVPNHTAQRDVSAIYYLNDSFDGGEIVFEPEACIVKPRRGLLLAFPSDHDHVHEVLPVRSGFRYTMPIWFTKQQCFAMDIAG
jgi:2OG-Fe(II) oxygenase superfamily